MEFTQRSRLGPLYAFTAAVLAAIAFSVTGCGGGSSAATADRSGTSSSTTTSTGDATPGGRLSKSQLIAQADAICSRLNVELAALKPKGESLKEVLRIVPHNVASERRALEQLGKLQPPAAQAAAWQRILGYRRTLASELAKLVVAVRRSDASALVSLSASKKRVHGELHAAAASSGFKDCTKVGSH